MLRTFIITFDGYEPPRMLALASILEQAREYDRFDANFSIQEQKENE